jgi:hypothetical protein
MSGRASRPPSLISLGTHPGREWWETVDAHLYGAKEAGKEARYNLTQMRQHLEKVLALENPHEAADQLLEDHGEMEMERMDVTVAVEKIAYERRVHSRLHGRLYLGMILCLGSVIYELSAVFVRGKEVSLGGIFVSVACFIALGICAGVVERHHKADIRKSNNVLRNRLGQKGGPYR